MSLQEAVDREPVPTVTFVSSSVGLWAAIVHHVVVRDPAGSESVGPSWPGRPVVGMFDLAPATAG